MIIVENVHYHKSAQLATAQSAEADYERRGNYVGPPFGNLDEELQAHFEKYLDEREINTTLAIFIPDYIDYKEQKEYCAWLKSERQTFYMTSTLPNILTHYASRCKEIY